MIYIIILIFDFVTNSNIKKRVAKRKNKILSSNETECLSTYYDNYNSIFHFRCKNGGNNILNHNIIKNNASILLKKRLSKAKREKSELDKKIDSQINPLIFLESIKSTQKINMLQKNTHFLTCVDCLLEISKCFVEALKNNPTLVNNQCTYKDNCTKFVNICTEEIVFFDLLSEEKYSKWLSNSFFGVNNLISYEEKNMICYYLSLMLLDYFKNAFLCLSFYDLNLYSEKIKLIDSCFDLYTKIQKVYYNLQIIDILKVTFYIKKVKYLIESSEDVNKLLKHKKSKHK